MVSDPTAWERKKEEKKKTSYETEFHWAEGIRPHCSSAVIWDLEKHQLDYGMYMWTDPQ